MAILALATGTHDGALRDRLFSVVDSLAGPRFAADAPAAPLPDTVPDAVPGSAWPLPGSRLAPAPSGNGRSGAPADPVTL
jgi:hypothetical protein